MGSKRYAIYVQTYSILKLIEPLIYDDNNLLVNTVHRETNKFVIPVHHKNVYVRLSAVNNATANGFSKNARIKVNVALANPTPKSFNQWSSWLDERSGIAHADDDAHARARAESKAGRKKAI